MATNEPMTDNMLTDDEREIITEEYIRSVKRELAKALAEIAHLHAREQALAAENEQKQAQIDAMRPVVEAVAALEPTELGTDWGQTELGYAIEDVDPVIEQACVFIAAHPATDTAAAAAGEVESEDE